MKGNHIQNPSALLATGLCVCINLFMASIYLFVLYLKYLLFSVFSPEIYLQNGITTSFRLYFVRRKKFILRHREWFVLFIPNRLPLHLLQFEWIFIANEWSELYEIFYAPLYQGTSFSLLKKLVLISFSSTATFSTSITHFYGLVFSPLRRQMIRVFFQFRSRNFVNKSPNGRILTIFHAFFIPHHLRIIFLQELLVLLWHKLKGIISTTTEFTTILPFLWQFYYGNTKEDQFSKPIYENLCLLGEKLLLLSLSQSLAMSITVLLLVTIFPIWTNNFYGIQ